ncbi:unnamed protein product [Arctogadus glacialis]
MVKYHGLGVSHWVVTVAAVINGKCVAELLPKSLMRALQCALAWHLAWCPKPQASGPGGGNTGVLLTDDLDPLRHQQARS